MEKCKFAENIMEPSAKEYAFKIQENKRLELIQIIKNRRHLIIKGIGSRSNSKMYESKYKKDISDISLTDNEKQREKKILNMKLLDEISRSQCFQSKMLEKEIDEMKKEEELRLKSLKEKQNMLQKVERELERKKQEKIQDKEQRKLLFEKIKLEQMRDEILEKQRKYEEAKRKQEIEEKNRKRFEIAEKAQLIRQEKIERFAKKMEKSKTIQNIRPQSREKSQNDILSYRHEKVKEKVLEIKEIDMETRKQKYENLCNKLNSGTVKNSEIISKRISKIRRNLSQKFEKVKETRQQIFQKTISEYEKIMEKDSEKTKKVQSVKHMKSKEIFAKKDKSKVNFNLNRENLERLQRKEEYSKEQLRQKIEEKITKINVINKEKEEFINLKKKEQFASEKQREKLKQALNYMAIWNVWDLRIIEKILSENNLTSEQIESMIRMKSRKVKVLPRPGTVYSNEENKTPISKKNKVQIMTGSTFQTIDSKKTQQKQDIIKAYY